MAPYLQGMTAQVTQEIFLAESQRKPKFDF